MNYKRASDEELREAGYDPAWIAERDPEEGPFHVYRDNNGACPCCGGTSAAWTVLNVSTATGIGQDWHGDEGETEAEEHASALNGAWSAGFAAASR